MSDYIYGSSLRAAKSKANYLFEGDFRRRPNQNLSGASRSMARVELLQQAAEQRQSREDNRRKEQASVKLQSVWRGYYCRRKLASDMRTRFDDMIDRLNVSVGGSKGHLREDSFELISRDFIIFNHSEKDQERFKKFIELIQAHYDVVIKSKTNQPKLWTHRITKLLVLNLKLLERHSTLQESTNHLSFLENFTRLGHVLDEEEALKVWQSLIENRFFTVMRKLVDQMDNVLVVVDLENSDKYNQTIIELMRRSLDLQPKDHGPNNKISTVSLFYKEFLKGPCSESIHSYYFSELLKLEPKSLNPSYLISEFWRAQTCSTVDDRSRVNFSSDTQQECIDAAWLCYSFVRTIHTQVDRLSNSEKANYLIILSKLIAPAEHITNVALMQAANNEDDQNEESADDINSSTMVFHYNLNQKEIHNVITRLIDLINHIPHINGLKPVIFDADLQLMIQSSVVKICNLMLAHEHLAIFNCRLLYTVAFSKEFSRSLWKSIISSTGATLYGTNTPIYLQISRGSNISYDSWRTILPKLRLFCSLCSYLIPTLDDGEFYTDENDSMFDSADGQHEKSQTETSSSGAFFVDRELISISAILRDICVGFIEQLYHSNRYQSQQPSTRFAQNPQDEKMRLLSFETKICFKALVRLVCQLQAKDSRKQFCPDGHWICPSVAIPANKAIDFQLLTSQQGRLLNQMTKDDSSAERIPTTPNEIKTVLILQEIPFIISFQDRVKIFHQLLRKEKLVHQSDDYHFGLPGTAIQVQIRRNYIYEDAFEKLSFENEPNLKLPLKVSLINAVGADEAGIDGGGLSKEFLGELLKAGFDPMRGFFKSTKDNHLYPNPSANILFSTLLEGYEVHYEFLGRMLGKAIFEKIMVELPLAGFFLAKLLASKHSSDVDLHNLESLDPVLYRNLVYLKNYKGDVADLNLDFTISNNELGEHEMVELKSGGSKIPVTKENKIEYVHLVADYRLNKQIRAQCAAFKRGLTQLVDLDWLRMFDPRELQILISGAPTMIDIEDWRRHTIYSSGYTDDCEAINTFWRVVSQFDENQKRKLLKFATSCSLPPLLGFKELVPEFAIAPSEESRLPTASTCMNLLKLPGCEDENTMRAKLLYAIESNSGFELS